LNDKAFETWITSDDLFAKYFKSIFEEHAAARSAVLYLWQESARQATKAMKNQIVNYLENQAEINKSANDDSHYYYTMIVNEIKKL